MKHILLAISALWLVGTHAATVESRERRITVSAAPGSGKAWLDFALRADGDVQKFLGGDAVPPKHRLRIHVGPDRKTEGVLRLSFTGREFRTEIAQRIYTSLLCRAAFPEPGKVPSLPSTQWMAAALASHELSTGRQMPGRKPTDYESVRAGFRKGVFPLVERLLSKPVPATSPILYLFYALHCELLATSIRSAPFPKETPFRRILELEVHGRSTVAATEFVLRPFFAEGETLQGWYERTAPVVSRRGSHLSPVEEVVQRLQELTMVNAISLNGGAQKIKRIPIEDLPEKLADYRINPDAIDRVHKQIFELVQDAPVLLREPLAAYMNAFGLLGKGKKRAFLRTIRRARKDFDAAVERQRAIGVLLDRIEEDYSSPTQQLAPYLRTVERADQDARALDPALHMLLDKANE